MTVFGRKIKLCVLIQQWKRTVCSYVKVFSLNSCVQIFPHFFSFQQEEIFKVGWRMSALKSTHISRIFAKNAPPWVLLWMREERGGKFCFLRQRISCVFLSFSSSALLLFVTSSNKFHYWAWTYFFLSNWYRSVVYRHIYTHVHKNFIVHEWFSYNVFAYTFRGEKRIDSNLISHREHFRKAE